MLSVLNYCENSLAISDFVHYQADVEAGNPYNTSFNIAIVSGPFSGFGPFECDIKDFIAFTREINELYEFHRIEVKLQDICYGSHVNFEMDRIGHLIVSGEIFGNATIQSLKFEFEADQTALKPFADSLKLIYTKCDR